MLFSSQAGVVPDVITTDALVAASTVMSPSSVHGDASRSTPSLTFSASGQKGVVVAMLAERAAKSKADGDK